MKFKIPTVARVFLGLIYFVFGLNGFFYFLKMTPPPMSETAAAFFKGIHGSGYFIPVLSGTQTLGGFLLLTGLAAPLALVILAPVTLQIFLFHYFLTPGLKNLVLPMAMLVLHLTAAVAYWKVYKPLFSKG